jgi:ribose transport system substrate-binding protein
MTRDWAFRRTRRLLTCAGMVAAAATLAACGSDSETESTAPASGGADAAPAANIAASQQLLDEYSKEPAFEAPGPEFDAKAGMAGKKVMTIPVTSEIPITQVLTEEMAAQAKRIGFTYKAWQNQGKVDQWVQGIETAIAQKYDTVDLLAIDPKLLKPQIDKAREAGVKVISSHLAGFGWEVPDYIDGAVRLPYYEVGRLLGAWTIVKTDGKADAVAIVAEDLASTADVVKGMEDEFAENCSDCKLTTRNVPTTQWATGVQNEVRSGVQANPNVNAVIPIYDAMTQFALAGLQQAGKAGKVVTATFNGTPFALEMVADGKLDMNIGENEIWIARAMLDAAMRAAMDEEVPGNHYEKAPLLVFTKDNVAGAGTPPDPAKGYGDAYEAGFDALWGIE